MTKTKALRARPSGLRRALNEAARAMRANGTMDAATFAKITKKTLGRPLIETSTPLAGPEIRAMREQANMSQAVFAQYLGLTTGYLSELEREARKPSGSTLALLNVIRRKGIEAIL
jgi:putative transcriptional regulator